MTEFRIRLADSSDLNFIYDTFLNSLHYDTELGKSCRNDIFYPEYQKIIDRILLRSTIKVACHQEEPSVIFGYLIFEPDILHYCFIKQSFRRLGIATALFNDSFTNGFVYATHLTRSGVPTLKKFNLIFNPFILYKEREDETKSESHAYDSRG